jgi:hypothetical protein
MTSNATDDANASLLDFIFQKYTNLEKEKELSVHINVFPLVVQHRCDTMEMK